MKNELPPPVDSGTMSPPPSDCYAGEWNGEYLSRFHQRPHQMKLVLTADKRDVSGELKLKRCDPDPIGDRLEYDFSVQGFDSNPKEDHRFVGLLCRDDAGLGLIVMMLKFGSYEDREFLRGKLLFNNVRTLEVETGEITWLRSSTNPFRSTS